jgi:hypothetical protein
LTVAVLLIDDPAVVPAARAGAAPNAVAASTLAEASRFAIFMSLVPTKFCA